MSACRGPQSQEIQPKVQYLLPYWPTIQKRNVHLDRDEPRQGKRNEMWQNAHNFAKQAVEGRRGPRTL